MSKTVTCPNCGHGNPITTVFCRTCGKRLNLAGMTREELEVKPSPWPLVRQITRAVFTVLVLTIAVLLFWPVAPAGDLGGRHHAMAASEKIKSLNSAALNGLEREVNFTEAEVNGYLARLVAEGASGGTTTLDDINLNFEPRDVTLLVVARWAKIPITQELRGVPVVGDGTFEFKLRRARFGHLPLPGFGRRKLMESAGVIFMHRDTERELLERLTDLKLGEGNIRAVVRPTS
jgi:hypothetical protein